MAAPDRLQETDSPTQTTSEQSNGTGSAETIEPSEVDPENIIETEAGELMHEPTGLILDERQIDRGPEWRFFTQAERDKNRASVRR